MLEVCAALLQLSTFNMAQELTIKCDFKDDENGLGSALSWASIGLAVLTAIFQGMVTALAFMTESCSLSISGGLLYRFCCWFLFQ